MFEWTNKMRNIKKHKNGIKQQQEEEQEQEQQLPSRQRHNSTNFRSITLFSRSQYIKCHLTHQAFWKLCTRMRQVAKLWLLFHNISSPSSLSLFLPLSPPKTKSCTHTSILCYLAWFFSQRAYQQKWACAPMCLSFPLALCWHSNRFRADTDTTNKLGYIFFCIANTYLRHKIGSLWLGTWCHFYQKLSSQLYTIRRIQMQKSKKQKPKTRTKETDARIFFGNGTNVGAHSQSFTHRQQNLMPMYQHSVIHQNWNDCNLFVCPQKRKKKFQNAKVIFMKFEFVHVRSPFLFNLSFWKVITN